MSRLNKDQVIDAILDLIRERLLGMAESVSVAFFGMIQPAAIFWHLLLRA